MIARLQPKTPPAAACEGFLNTLWAHGFKGEISTDYGTRTVLATDNSIYQRLPQAALFPRDSTDVELVARLVAMPEHSSVVLTPRGGGTGTNGQSLTDGILVDLSRHLNNILEINVEKRWVRVQSGVVKDQLNDFLEPYGYFFAPELSTSNRATVGGMINTDASGQGSCTYGKTRDHVLELSTVLLGGARLDSRELGSAGAAMAATQSGKIGDIYRCTQYIAAAKAKLIQDTFPELNRCLTGYDLAHLRSPDGQFNLNSVLCGSEGTLGFIVEAKLNILPIPRVRTLVNVRYPSFMDALRDAKVLMALKPLSIETVDSKVLLLAMEDIVWRGVAEFFPEDCGKPALGINLIEFSGDDQIELERQVNAFTEHLLKDNAVPRLGYTLAVGAEAVKRVYAMRKRAVGLLGNVQGEARPQPFVEDTAVPPENLASYIEEFRALLDSYNLQYGMFGHVDAGVLHVRPILDMKDERQAAFIRPISDAVVALTRKYGGLLWGEHGKGLRSEYAPEYFGELYASLQDIKAVFDPLNQLNPGKIATPASVLTAHLTKVDEVGLRGQVDRQIDERVWQGYQSAVQCNGNGACYNFDPDDAMCPSWKATRDRVQSPKGRASLIREWIRLQGNHGVNILHVQTSSTIVTVLKQVRNSIARQLGQKDFSHEVYDAMAGCLACKSCSGHCPVKVNVPEFRSQFLELYHGRYLRPIKDYLVGSLEFTVPYAARVPRLYNALMSSAVVSWGFKHWAGMVDSPLLSTLKLSEACKKLNVLPATHKTLSRLTEAERKRSVILVQDAFTSYFDTQVTTDWIKLLGLLGFNVLLAPFSPNGKPLQVLGFQEKFKKTASRNAEALSRLQRHGVPLVGLDPAMTLVYRQEYTKALGERGAPKVQLPQEWLATVLPEQVVVQPKVFHFLPHCTERTNFPASTDLWKQVFKLFGLELKTLPSGCCGMSGTYGHETRNLKTSTLIYSQSWQPLVSRHQSTGTLVADGYSCRSQVKRQDGKIVLHPLQVLLENLPTAR
ncbi:FAD-binding protein [Pseudomonas sp. CCM 7893]|uniref:D-2-hydroxyglutarate dehydrogenase n=1 Tax=Pseudomonas spelaei TaxID=1055469 RepID=A0A6I3WC12_9PSED|nr:FAD-binding and (Fe-S)-binding domain-containing protein [Pseudomonas spelaei]MUF08270.1 FAD-binding protein [Pseudomonas spelaei]